MTPKEKRIKYINSQEPHSYIDQLAIEVFKKEISDNFSEEEIQKWAENKRKELNDLVTKELEKINKNLNPGEEPYSMKELARGSYKISYDKLHVMEMIAYMW